MKKQFLATLIFLFIGISAFSMINTSIAQENKCGDNVCDEFESANPNVCPTDCTVNLITTRITERKIFNDYNYPILYPIVNKILDKIEENLFLTIWIPFILALILGELLLKKDRRILAFFSPVLIYFIYLVMISFSLGSDGALAAFLLLMYMSIFLPINYITLVLRFLFKYRKSILNK